MKIVCSNCNTNYQIDDSKIPEKGLLVKCSACGNKFRVFKETSNADESSANDTFEENKNKAKEEMDSLFDSVPANNNKAADDLDDILGGHVENHPENQDIPEDNPEHQEPEKSEIEMASYHDEIADNAVKSDSKGVTFDKSGASDLNLSNDRFDEEEEFFADDFSDENKQKEADDLFSSDPLKKSGNSQDNDQLFSDAPQKNPAETGLDDLFSDSPKKNNPAGEDFDDLFSDSPKKNNSAGKDFDDLFSSSPKNDMPRDDKKTKEDLFGDSSDDDLFSDIPDNGKKSDNGADDFLKELFGETPSKPSAEIQTIFFRNRKTGKVIGPVDESQVDKLMLNGEISEDDDISYDGVTWNTDSDSGNQAEKSEFEDAKIDDAFGNVLFEEGTMIHKDDISEEINFDDSHEESKVEHVYIPDEFNETSAGQPSSKQGKKKTGRRGGNSILFYTATSVATLAILAIIIGGAYYFYTKRNNSADILDNISEQIAVNTGTLADVREALDKDTPEDYMNSIGILKQYIKPGDSAPSAVGLDGQVKMNLLISYNKRIESSASIDDKISSAMKKAPGNIDLVKAKALYLYEQKQYDAAAELIQPFTDKNDQEIFYILGLLASGKHDLEKAENFFNTGFIQGGGKSIKIMYALANMKYQNGDTQSAMAFLNRIISEMPNYIKAYLLKSKILMNSDNKLAEADKFLKDIDTNIIAKAEDFQKAEYYQMLATIANRRGLMKEAIKYYEKSVEINQTDTDAITKIADFYVQISDSTKAMEYYDMALKIDQKHSAAIIGKTEIYVLLSQKEKIYLELAKLDLKTLTNPQLLARVAKIYSNIGDKVKAIEFYDLAIKSDPSYIEPYIAKAQILLMDFNKVKELEQILIVLEKLGKDRYPYHMVKAIIDHKNADYKSAAAHFKLADEKNSAGDERVFFFYGEFLKDQQKYAEASKMLHRAHTIDPENYDYLQSYVDSLEKEKKWKNVIALLESKTFVEKRKYKSYSSLANAYFHVKEYEKALTAINHALELNSQSTYNYYLKARILYTMGRYPEAEKEIDTAVVLDMKNFDNYMLYARILSKRGDYKGAVEKIEAAEKIDPTDQDLLLMKGVIYKNLDDYRNALKYFNRVTNKSLKREAYLEIGESYLQLGKRKEAMEYLKKAEKSGNRAAEKHIATILYENGNIDQAIIYFKKVLSHNKNDMDALRQLGYIYKERGENAKALSYFKIYLKKVTDHNEKEMIQNDVYYLQQSLPQGKQVKEADLEEDQESLNERIQDLYEEGKDLREDDPEEAKKLFQEVMKIAPKGSEYYKKASKALNKLKEQEQNGDE